jgi:hypothetical protein
VGDDGDETDNAENVEDGILQDVYAVGDNEALHHPWQVGI